MAKRGVGVTKKHLARAERESRQRRWILTGAIVVAVLLISVLAYGIYDTAFVQPFQTVAVVNGETITSREFAGRVRLIQRELLSQLSSYMQMESLFGADPTILQELRNLEVQLQTQLANPELLGRDVLESMIRQRILIAEAGRQNVSVSEQELEREVQRNFNYFPDGTPTSAASGAPLPTSTIDPTQESVITPSSSASPEPSPTTGPTSTPQSTATPYTFEAYQNEYDTYLGSLSDFRIREDDFLAYLEIGMLDAKMRANFVADINREQEQVFVSVILAENEDIANQILERMESGETWQDLALEFSQDVGTRDAGGELGWSTLSDLLGQYGQPGIAAFASEAGSIVGPFAGEGGGFYLFKVDERAVRPISEQAYQLALNQAFDDWLQGLRDEAEVSLAEDWQQFLPAAVPVNF